MDTGLTVWAAGFWANDVWAAGFWSSLAPVVETPTTFVAPRRRGRLWITHHRRTS